MTAPELPGPRGPQAEVRRDQILAAVLDCLGSGGFGALSMRAVAERAGVPLGSLHYYFRDKEDMVGAALARSVDEIVRGLAEQADESASPRARLRVLVCEWLPRLCTDPATVPVYIGFWSWCQQVPERRALYRRVAEGVQARVLRLIQDGVRRGEFRLDDPAAGARMVRSALVGFLLDQHGEPPDPAVVAGLLRRLEAALGVSAG